VSRDIFFIILNHIFVFGLACFFKGNRLVFEKLKLHVTPGAGVRVSPNYAGEVGGSKIGPKSVMYYLNGPLHYKVCHMSLNYRKLDQA